jgi:ribosomal protein S18 acetylase RimI-like enzyme
VLDRADAWFGALGRGYTVLIRDLPVDADLRAAAEARGLLEVTSPPEMVCRARLDDLSPPDGVELRWVHDAHGIRDFVEVSSAAYGSLGMPLEVMPAIVDPDVMQLDRHVQTVVAYVDGSPVAAAQTLLSHGIAGVYWVGTVEAGRGRGLGEAVTRAVTNRAFDLGATANTLQASPMGEPIYRRMGYETLYRYRTFCRFEPA